MTYPIYQPHTNIYYTCGLFACRTRIVKRCENDDRARIFVLNIAVGGKVIPENSFQLK